jgi:hypothetical protein
VDITVNPNNLPVDANGKPAFNNGSGGPSQTNWVNLMEAAYAKYNDIYKTNTNSHNAGLTGYDAIMNDAVDDVSFNYALTGTQSAVLPLPGQKATDVATVINQALASGQPVEAYNYDTAATAAQQPQPDQQDSEGHTISGGHAYAVVGISTDGKTVTLRDPRGVNDSATTGEHADGTFTMTMADFQSVFEQINA